MSRYRRGLNSEDKFNLFLVGLVAVVAIVFLIALYSSKRDVTCTVESFDRVTGDARIYTKECGVLTNKDSWPFLKFDSADIQGKLKQGQVQNFTVEGWRIPFLSKFPNVLEVK